MRLFVTDTPNYSFKKVGVQSDVRLTKHLVENGICVWANCMIAQQRERVRAQYHVGEVSQQLSQRIIAQCRRMRRVLREICKRNAHSFAERGNKCNAFRAGAQLVFLTTAELPRKSDFPVRQIVQIMRLNRALIRREVGCLRKRTTFRRTHNAQVCAARFPQGAKSECRPRRPSTVAVDFDFREIFAVRLVNLGEYSEVYVQFIIQIFAYPRIRRTISSALAGAEWQDTQKSARKASVGIAIAYMILLFLKIISMLRKFSHCFLWLS